MTAQYAELPQAHILLVDDNPDNLRLLSKILEAHGNRVRKSLSGKMALQATHREPPDLILLDINMPEMSGYDVCQQLKASEQTRDIPVIFISALDQLDDKIRAFELGGADYITKPFQEQEVLMRVRNQILIQQQRKQLLQQNQRLELEIQERLKAEAAVRQLSLTDELTGLYNRRGFLLLASQQLKIARRTQTGCCILFADLDGLKQINDAWGHEAGDRLIKEAALVLKETFRDSDVAARLGGDEFVVFISLCPDDINDFSTRLQTHIQCFNQQPERWQPLSMSFGVKYCEVDEDFSLEELMAQADELMYEHKRTKRLTRQEAQRDSAHAP